MRHKWDECNTSTTQVRHELTACDVSVTREQHQRHDHSTSLILITTRVVFERLQREEQFSSKNYLSKYLVSMPKYVCKVYPENWGSLNAATKRNFTKSLRFLGPPTIKWQPFKIFAKWKKKHLLMANIFKLHKHQKLGLMKMHNVSKT